ncbi:hypothetical protein GOBAR_AA29848 [Gossypium barbadense]|uniref:Condensin complex subunit 1 C-terminal domain-containing protein n=1 Tax=Gossypium barbadense TaxID=3634 RepID=A0A2P5WIB5_GOSBA|nr:hypothetical protein GOBAR_AA29848 [Gossypium barbadense]
MKVEGGVPSLFTYTYVNVAVGPGYKHLWPAKLEVCVLRYSATSGKRYFNEIMEGFSVGALYASVDKYLHGLFGLANDPAAEVRKLVCAAFVQLIEVRPSVLEPHMKNVIEYMLQVNKDTDDEVALEACEFW